MELVTRKCWWPGITRDIGKYMERCDLCQWMKNRMEEIVEKLKLSQVPEKLWTYLTVDFITKLPIVAEKDMILVVYDRLFKLTYFVATSEEMLAEGWVRLFRNNIWKLHGLPKSVISDRDPQFAAGLMKELNRMLGIEMRLSMAFHPQMNRQIEWMNQELEQYLRFFVDHRWKK